MLGLVWRGLKVPSGYGSFYTGEKSLSAHRFAYESKFGPIQRGLLVCHKCDNRLCVRPDHLFVGTKADNGLRSQREVASTEIWPT